MRKVLFVVLCATLTVVWVAGAGASTPTTDVRLTNDCVVPSTPDPATPASAPPGYTPPAACAAGTPTPGYVSAYTLATGTPVNDPVINECTIAHGRQNEPAAQMDPRDPSVILGSSNDYCGVYYTKDADGFPVANGPIWLGYYHSTNGGASFQSSLVPGYPGDPSPYAALSQARTASAGDPMIAWDAHGRVFFSAETSDDPAGTKKTFGDLWVATFDNPDGPASTNTKRDGLRYRGTTLVATGSSAPNLLGVFHDKPAIEADHTGSSPCDGDVYVAWARFTGVATSNIYFSRSTDHGATFSKPVLLTQNVSNVQDADIGVTGNGHVYITFDEGSRNNGQTDGVGVVKSVDCGASFSRPTVLVAYTSYVAQDIQDPHSPAKPSQPDDPPSDEGAAAPAGVAGDCGDFADHCQSGFTFFRRGTTTRSTADQYDAQHEWVYVVFDASRGPILDTGTTYGTIVPGKAADTAVYYVRYDGATGDATTPVLLDPTGAEQTFPDISADGGVLHVLWWDARNAPADCRSPIRPIGNCSDGTSVPALDVFATTGTSTAAGTIWATPVQVTDVTSNGNWEQFDDRKVPFGGDYLWITSNGTNAFGTWTDWRDTKAGTDPREAPEDEDAASTDVYQCRAVLTSTDKKGNTTSSFSSDRCPHSGGLDQNIYGDSTP